MCEISNIGNMGNVSIVSNIGKICNIDNIGDIGNTSNIIYSRKYFWTVFLITFSERRICFSKVFLLSVSRMFF